MYFRRGLVGGSEEDVRVIRSSGREGWRWGGCSIFLSRRSKIGVFIRRIRRNEEFPPTSKKTPLPYSKNPPLPFPSSVRSSDRSSGTKIEDRRFFVLRGRRSKVEEKGFFVIRSSFFGGQDRRLKKGGSSMMGGLLRSMSFFIVRLRKNREPPSDRNLRWPVDRHLYYVYIYIYIYTHFSLWTLLYLSL